MAISEEISWQRLRWYTLGFAGTVGGLRAVIDGMAESSTISIVQRLILIFGSKDFHLAISVATRVLTLEVEEAKTNF